MIAKIVSFFMICSFVLLTSTAFSTSVEVAEAAGTPCCKNWSCDTSGCTCRSWGLCSAKTETDTQDQVANLCRRCIKRIQGVCVAWGLRACKCPGPARG